MEVPSVGAIGDGITQPCSILIKLYGAWRSSRWTRCRHRRALDKLDEIAARLCICTLGAQVSLSAYRKRLGYGGKNISTVGEGSLRQDHRQGSDHREDNNKCHEQNSAFHFSPFTSYTDDKPTLKLR